MLVDFIHIMQVSQYLLSNVENKMGKYIYTQRII